MERLGEMQWHIYEYSTNLCVDLKKYMIFFILKQQNRLSFSSIKNYKFPDLKVFFSSLTDTAVLLF